LKITSNIANTVENNYKKVENTYKKLKVTTNIVENNYQYS
jgi:hypothetical protein